MGNDRMMAWVTAKDAAERATTKRAQQEAFSMKTTVRRVMGEITFSTQEEAEDICAHLHAAGFESKISNGVDAMIWHDYDNELTSSDSIRNEFDFTVNVIIDLRPNFVDHITIVDPNHVPARFGDFGKQPVSSWWDCATAGGGSSVGLPVNTHKGENENDDQR
jgi:hypothetical protein